MATYRKVARGWRAEVCINKQRKSKTLATKKMAERWAIQTEIELASGESLRSVKFKDVLDRYLREVTQKKKSKHSEKNRIMKIMEEPIAEMSIGKIKTPDLCRWRDKRATEVTVSTVNRELALLSNVFTIARKEWHLIKESPAKDVGRFKMPEPRDRRISQHEIDLICQELDYSEQARKVRSIFLFGLETAMRRGEICNLVPEDIEGPVATIRDSKNGTSRKIPLSKKALEIIESGMIFGIEDITVTRIFGEARDRAGIKDLHFHDVRHEAITRLAKKLQVLDLARMTGHKDIKMLMVYYNESAEDIAKKLG